MKFILASKSPRRKEILEKINLKFEIVPSNIDESVIEKQTPPKDYCIQLAVLKAQNVSNIYNKATVIGADTIVVINDNILNKPKNIRDAENMLNMLSNNEHQVITGVSIENKNLNISHSFYDISSVSFYKLSNKEIKKYIDIYKPLDKSGSYGIQDGSAIFVKRIIGSYDNIMGFPVSKFYQFIKKIKLV